MLFQTTQAHEELRAKVRAFAEEEIKPIAFMLDQQNEFPDEAIRKLLGMGHTTSGPSASIRSTSKYLVQPCSCSSFRWDSV